MPTLDDAAVTVLPQLVSISPLFHFLPLSSKPFSHTKWTAFSFNLLLRVSNRMASYLGKQSRTRPEFTRIYRHDKRYKWPPEETGPSYSQTNSAQQGSSAPQQDGNATNATTSGPATVSVHNGQTRYEVPPLDDNGEDYTQWSRMMKLVLRRRGLP
jgi:hypothetical protein